MTCYRPPLLAALALCLTASFGAAHDKKSYKLTALSLEVQQHIEAGKALTGGPVPKSAVGEFFNTARFANYIDPKFLPPPDHPMGAHEILAPTKAFDQFYYVGNVFVGSWVSTRRTASSCGMPWTMWMRASTSLKQASASWGSIRPALSI
jgi:hypothetical protein